MAITATLLPNGKQQFFSAGGIPLAGGSVGMYAPGTLTFKTTWVDPQQAVPNANPITLDSGGEAIIYGYGQYRQIVKDSLGNIIWDQLTNDYLSLAQTGIYYGGTSGGSANNQTVSTTPGFSTYTQPITITFIAGFTNTGAMTLNANGIGALNIYKQTSSGPVPLTGGEIINGNVYQVSYDGTEFQILSGGGSAVFWGATSGGSANTQTVSTIPAFTFYTASQVLYFIAGFTNTGPTTINANGIGTANIFKETTGGPAALSGNEIVAGNVYQLVYDGIRYLLLNSGGGVPYGGTTTGSANAQAASVSGFSLSSGAILSCIAGFTNTGATTLNVNSLGAVNIFKTTSSGPVALSGGEIVTGNILLIEYDGTRFQLLNPVSSALTKSFLSAAQTVSNAGALTISHGMGTTPKILYCYLQCVTANAGYTGGEMVGISPNTSQGGTSRGYSIWPDGTNINVIFGADANVFYIFNKTTGGITAITASDWQFYVQAYA